MIKRFINSLLISTALLVLSDLASAMDIEVRPPYVVLSGGVTGIELRILKDALEKNPSITTVVLKNSSGGDARTGYAMGEFIREKGLATALSGYCRSSCSRMFMGGKIRSFSDDQPLERTYVAFHGNYDDRGNLISAAKATLMDWIARYSDGKANPQLVAQWVRLENHKGFAYFYHPGVNIDLGPQRVMICQGGEDPKTRTQTCAKPELGNALDNGILTTLEIVKMNRRPEESNGNAK